MMALLPKEVLREIFRGKFVDALEQAFQNGQLRFEGELKLLAQPKIFAAWLRPLFRQDWVVYLSRPFGGPQYVLQYLGRYTHRVAISNHRLVSSRRPSLVETVAGARQRRSWVRRGASSFRGSGAPHSGRPAGGSRRTCHEKPYSVPLWAGSSCLSS